MQTVINQSKEEANEIYKLLVQNPSDARLIEQYSLKYDQVHSIMEKLAIETKYKMKLNWLIKGDRPTSFSFNKMNVRNASQKCNFTLNSDGTWTSTSE